MSNLFKFKTVKFKNLVSLSFFLIAFFTLLKGQEIFEGNPILQNYNYSEYNAHQTIFRIIQDTNGIIYCANKDGILVFDGVSWDKITFSLKNSPLQLSLINDIIYVGCRNDVGYLNKDLKGSLEFVSIKHKFKGILKEPFEVNRIFGDDKRLFIRVQDYVYVFDKDSLFLVFSKKGADVQKINNKVYLKIIGDGLHLYNFLRDSLEYLPKTKKNIGAGDYILPYSNDTLILFTQNREFFLYNYNEQDKKVFFSKPAYLNNITPFLNENVLTYLEPYVKQQVVMGTYLNGLILLNTKGQIVKHVNVNSGLLANYIRLLQKDNMDNLWVVTENGLSYMLMNSPFSIYSNSSGIHDLINDAIIFKNNLYVATKSGVFVASEGNQFKKLNHDNLYFNSFIEIGEKLYLIGSIINYDEEENYENYLFELLKNKLIRQNQIPPVLNLVKLSSRNGYYLAFGKKIYLLRQQNNSLVHIKTVKNSPYLEQDFEYDEWFIEGTKNDIWFNSVYIKAQIIFNQKYDSVLQINKLHKEQLPSDYLNNIYTLKKNNGVANVVCLTESGIHAFDYEQNTFNPDKRFANTEGINLEYIEQDVDLNIYLSGYIRETGENRILFYRNTENGFIYEAKKELNKLSPYIYVKPFTLDSTNMLFRTPENFLLYKSNHDIDFDQKFNTLIRKVFFKDSLVFGGIGKPLLKNHFPFRKNKIRINYAGIFYEEHDKTEYNYMLEGFENQWSGWTLDTEKEFINLSEGSYTFKVKARNIYKTESNIAEFKFRILPPWYRTTLAFIAYFILSIFLIIIIVRIYTYSLKKDKERLENLVKKRTKEIRNKNEILLQRNEEITSQRDEIEAQRNFAVEQKEIIEEQQKSITESIQYAKKIQKATLPNENYIIELLRNNFILYKPRDIVSGDFYWIRQIKENIVIAVADCTGHGVPGVILSVLGISLLNEIVQHRKIVQPNLALNELRKQVKFSLRQTGKREDTRDGMDIAFCAIDIKTNIMQYAGAFNPLLLIKYKNGKSELTEIKADRMPVGIYLGREQSFTNHKIQLETGDNLFGSSHTAI